MKYSKIIELTDPKWHQIVRSSYMYDIYHTQAYSSLNKLGDPVLFVAFSCGDFIALPLIIRQIGNTGWFDVTSVYGYCGPISNIPFEELSTEHISYFQSELLSYFQEKKIVSAFSRLHPIMNQAPVFTNFGKMRYINDTVLIDLQLPKEKQYNNYRRNHRKNIEALIQEGYFIRETRAKEEIDKFIEIYYDNMSRIGAHSSYFFDRAYFYRFLDNVCFKSKLFLVIKDNEIIGGGLFSFVDDIIEAHLTCDNFKYKGKSPVKLIFNHVRLLGSDLKMKYFHLGGGRHGSSDDSLFKFKAGFSNIRLKYHTWELIVDKQIYKDLVDYYKFETKLKEKYFPAYRSRDIENTNSYLNAPKRIKGRQIWIYGASVHGKVILDILTRLGYEIEGFIDDDLDKDSFMNHPVIKPELLDLNNIICVMGIGDNKARKNIAEKYDIKYLSIIHPSAYVSSDSIIRQGTVITAMSVVNTGCYIGQHCIINTRSSVDHDCQIGDYVHIAPGATICGNVTIGSLTWIGAGAVIRENINIGSNVMIGAGSVVVKDIPDNAFVIGVPGRITKFLDQIKP